MVLTLFQSMANEECPECGNKLHFSIVPYYYENHGTTQESAIWKCSCGYKRVLSPWFIANDEERATFSREYSQGLDKIQVPELS